VNHSGEWETTALLRAKEFAPRHITGPGTVEMVNVADPPRCLPKFEEAKLSDDKHFASRS
jgi:hypothetical protein